jgi:hypothetical protein
MAYLRAEMGAQSGVESVVLLAGVLAHNAVVRAPCRLDPSEVHKLGNVCVEMDRFVHLGPTHMKEPTFASMAPLKGGR